MHSNGSDYSEQEHRKTFKTKEEHSFCTNALTHMTKEQIQCRYTAPHNTCKSPQGHTNTNTCETLFCNHAVLRLNAHMILRIHSMQSAMHACHECIAQQRVPTA